MAQPGTFPITDIPLTLVDAINSAGGLTNNADLFDVRLTRGNNSYLTPLYDILFEGDVAKNVVLQHGDVVHVAPNERRQVFILGEVLKLEPAVSPPKVIFDFGSLGRGISMS